MQIAANWCNGRCPMIRRRLTTFDGIMKRRTYRIAVCLLMASACGPSASTELLPPSVLVEQEVVELRAIVDVDDATIAQSMRATVHDESYDIYQGAQKMGSIRYWARPTVAGEPGAYSYGEEETIALSSRNQKMRARREAFYDGSPPFLLVEKRIRLENDRQVIDHIAERRGDRMFALTLIDGQLQGERHLGPVRDTVLPTLLQLDPNLQRMPIGTRATYWKLAPDSGSEHEVTIWLEKRQTDAVDTKIWQATFQKIVGSTTMRMSVINGVLIEVHCMPNGIRWKRRN